MIYANDFGHLTKMAAVPIYGYPAGIIFHWFTNYFWTKTNRCFHSFFFLLAIVNLKPDGIYVRWLIVFISIPFSCCTKKFLYFNVPPYQISRANLSKSMCIVFINSHKLTK